jgi:hypothetical protein
MFTTPAAPLGSLPISVDALSAASTKPSLTFSDIAMVTASSDALS